ncbi:sensor histidine kinase [Bradyrhizobium elkanii]|uniref:sensor histidine kinase n=1 Tax=Bradyrhizobium elkanii TaxID=29448 RepID=UPI001BAD9AC3|nr:HAMP domain-containing sensor histidine kinase [Bradyrhizobium elkanii]MBR1159676.1 HAMP domain-containing histidine kinase [Bradyrhizobium elkanii]
MHGTRRSVRNVEADGSCSAATSATISLNKANSRQFESALLAIAGHDLRQPLQVMRSVHERLDDGLRTRSELSLLELGQGAIDRLAGQLDQLLSALRISERDGHVELSPINLETLLREVEREHELAAMLKGLHMRVVSTRSWVRSDAFLLGSVLRNLVSNAVKYTEPGGRILVGCRQFRNCVRIDVLDTGIGISSEHMSRMFEAFARLDVTCGEGLGIGLFIVRQVMGVLGHRIQVSSAVGCGTRFSIVAGRASANVHERRQ